MTFITEEMIDVAAEAMAASEATYEHVIEELQTRQPIVLAYLFSENFQVFTQKEKEFMLYLLLVIYRAVRESGQALPNVRVSQLEEAEDRNWELVQSNKTKKFRERLDVLFQDYPQEDLLAFVEDAIMEEEEGFVTPEGREPIFIVLKSIIDSWLGYRKVG